MATAYHNLSEYDFNSVPDASNMKFGIVVSEWNYIRFQLCARCLKHEVRHRCVRVEL